MAILDHRDQWVQEYTQGWLAHHQQTGEFDWKLYPRPQNDPLPPTPGIDLRQSRLVLISTAGAYLKATQEPFDAPHPYGDYTLRTFPLDTPFADIDYAHDHYDHTAVNTDPQVLLPLRHLRDLERAGVIGSVAPTVISYSGYVTDLARIEDEMIPPILALAQGMGAQGALLVPA
ncbi:MAG: glycine/betaine/sarcosine/D-proline family reductase selenoprotein B [Anaerolineae bacterium]|nr:glycine/betaine/sarcosine/D-proline family reductase selenoprotein B [Anaerolineae bacterium]